MVGGAFVGGALDEVYWKFQTTASTLGLVGAYFSANGSKSVYIDNGKVYPLSLSLNYIIKN